MSTIRGEYWIHDGSVDFVDSNICDNNHTGYALDHLRQTIVAAIGMHVDYEYDWDRLKTQIADAVSDSLQSCGNDLPDAELLEDPYALLQHYAELVGIKPSDIDHAFERTSEDVRDYMAKNYGWICCHRDRFSTWLMTREQLKRISQAAFDIVEMEFCGHDVPDFELEIFVASTGQTYAVNYSELSDDYQALAQQFGVTGPNAQVQEIDRSYEHQYYRDRASGCA